MKVVVVFFSALIAGGLSCFGQTNNLPPTNQPAAKTAGQIQTETGKPALTGVPSGGELTHDAELQPAELANIRRISREGVLTPESPEKNRNYWASVQRMFRSRNDQMGETCICDTVMTIFPTGH